MHARPPPIGGLPTSRVETLCDGVFAIAMTLLVLGVAVPTAKTVPPDQLPGALAALAPNFVTYVMSFIMLGVCWIGHHLQYVFIQRTDRQLLWINLAFLLMITFVPFTTALLGAYPLHRMALALYGANLLMTGITLVGHWYYATGRKRMVAPDFDAAVIWPIARRVWFPIAAYAIGLIALAINPMVTFLAYAIIPPILIFPGAIDRILRGGAAP